MLSAQVILSSQAESSTLQQSLTSRVQTHSFTKNLWGLNSTTPKYLTVSKYLLTNFFSLTLMGFNFRLFWPIYNTNLIHIPAPDFVKMLEDDDYVYFFLREQAVEYINCGKVNINILIPCQLKSKPTWFAKSLE